MTSGMSLGEEYQSREDRGLKNSGGGVMERGWDFGDGHFMSGVEVTPSISEKVKTESEDQEDINIREDFGYGHKRKLAELDEAESDHASEKNGGTSTNQHISSSRDSSMNRVQKTDNIAPVEIRLLAALQREMGLSIGTAPSTQPVMDIPIAGDTILPSIQNPAVLPNPLSNSSTAPTVDTPLLEYRNRFPAEDVARLREHHWQILRHVIPPRMLGLGNKDAAIPAASDKPSSSVIDEMINHLSGTTKVACINFRKAQKHTWRKGQRKSRAITRATRGTKIPGTIDSLLGYSPRKLTCIQDCQQHHRGNPRHDLHDNGVYQQHSHLLQWNSIPHRAEYHAGNMQSGSLHPLIRPKPHFPQRGTDERKVVMADMPIANNSLDRRNLSPIGDAHSLPSGIGRQGLVSRPLSSLPDPHLLPRIILPLSEAEKAHIRLWLVKRD